MANFTDFAENHLIDFLFRGQALGITGATAAANSGPATLYVGLWTTTLVDASTGATAGEVTGGSYARVAVTSALTAWAGTQAAASTTASTGTNGTTSNNAAITFPAPTAAWGVITYAAICDAATGGNMLIWAPVTIAKTVNNGDPAPSIPAATFTFQIDN